MILSFLFNSNLFFICSINEICSSNWMKFLFEMFAEPFYQQQIWHHNKQTRVVDTKRFHRSRSPWWVDKHSWFLAKNQKQYTISIIDVWKLFRKFLQNKTFILLDKKTRIFIFRDNLLFSKVWRRNFFSLRVWYTFRI